MPKGKEGKNLFKIILKNTPVETRKGAILKKRYGILGQIMALFILVAIVMSALLLINFRIFVGMHEKISDQALTMVRKQKLHEEKMITSSRDEKVKMLTSIMLMTTPELVWGFDLPALELYAQAIAGDVDVVSVTFLGEDGEFLAGSKKTKGSKIISRDIINKGEMVGSIVIGTTSELIEKIQI
jgi:hypothetical protein